MSDDPAPQDRAADAAPGAPATRVAAAVPHAATPERQRFMRRLTPALLTVGAIVLVVFDSTFTLLLGVILLLSAVVSGVLMIAEPGFLAGDDD